jgi:spermidine/putrescine-binding protein
MGKILKELAKKHGFGLVMSVIAIDGYRRTVKNENKSKLLETIDQKQLPHWKQQIKQRRLNIKKILKRHMKKLRIVL